MIFLFWWGNNKGKPDNYGDMLAPFIVQALSGKRILKVSHPMRRIYRWVFKHYLTVGSIINVAGPNSIVWGSGIINSNQNVRKAKFLAVRGPRTRKRLLELGYQVPEVYGDPAILLPILIENRNKTVYELGIIPHYVDYDNLKEMFKDQTNVKIINLITDDVVKTTNEILECKKVVSTSLHGLIVSHAYQIPALWVKISQKLSGDDIKFFDYLESVGLFNFETLNYVDRKLDLKKLDSLFLENKEFSLPKKELFSKRQNELLNSCPFLKKK